MRAPRIHPFGCVIRDLIKRLCASTSSTARSYCFTRQIEAVSYHRGYIDSRWHSRYHLTRYISCINYQINRHVTRPMYSLNRYGDRFLLTRSARRLCDVATDAYFRQSCERKARSPLIMKRRSCRIFNYTLIEIELARPRQTNSEAEFDEWLWARDRKLRGVRTIGLIFIGCAFFLHSALWQCVATAPAIGDAMTSIVELIDTRVD